MELITTQSLRFNKINYLIYVGLQTIYLILKYKFHYNLVLS
jgi:hypothetical protein